MPVESGRVIMEETRDHLFHETLDSVTLGAVLRRGKDLQAW